MTHALLLVLASLLAATPARGQILHTFTPDPPPIGDDIEYPRTINPARQAPGGGVAPDFFDTEAGTIFQSTNGNPAFFDGSNLLTRPAARITNEAFWTDPKIGVFDSGMRFDVEEASFGFQFSPAGGADFGFDLAIASVSEAVPLTLPIFLQNANSPPDFGVFELGLTAGTGDIAPTEADTFDTSNGPFPGREARFRIQHSDVEALLGNGSPLLIASIDLRDVSTLGGTTQVALDDFVLAGASVLPNEPQREPARFQSALLLPGELQGFAFLPATPEPGDIEIDLSLLSTDLIEAAVIGESTSAVPATFEAEQSITWPDGTPMVDRRLRFEIDWWPSSPPDSVPPEVTPLEPSPRVEAPGSEGIPFFVEVQSFLSEAVDVTEDLVEELLIQQLFEAPSPQNPADLAELIETRRNAVMLLIDDPTGQRSARGTAPDTTLYGFYSLDEYLAELRQAGLEPVIGDTGGAFTPVTDDDGQIVDFRVTSWRIADEPGRFVPVLLVPEPGPVVMLAVGGIVLAAAARRRC